MPLHLDPLSRRRFLGGSAVLVLSPFLRDSATAAESETWALLSDTHIAADRTTVVRGAVNMADHLQRVVAEVLAEKDSLAGVIIDGDCAYLDGKAEDYATLIELLAPLREAGLPIHFTMGNHDDREKIAAALGEATGEPPVAGKRCTLIETPLANWILLDSLRYVNQVEGEFGADQLAWIARLLDAHPDKPAILVGHHNPQFLPPDVPGEEKPKITGILDTESFFETIRPRPSAKAYIYGHSHAWKLKQEEDGLHQVNLPTTAYVFNAAHPSGWVRATVTAGGLSLELRSLDPSHPGHGKTHDLAWR